MARAKTQLFTDKQNKLALQMKALSHPARIAIIQFLVHNKSLIGKHLVAAFGLSQATISQHLKELRNAGLIHGNKEYKTVRYILDRREWEGCKEAFNNSFEAGIENNKLS